MKKSEFKDLAAEDLLGRIKAEEGSLQRLKFGHAISPIENPMKIRYSRKLIARLKTELTSKSLKK